MLMFWHVLEKKMLSWFLHSFHWLKHPADAQRLELPGFQSKQLATIPDIQT